MKNLIILAILALLLLTGCLSYQMSKAWKGGSKVPPPPLPADKPVVKPPL